MASQMTTLPDEILQHILGLAIETRTVKQSSHGVITVLTTCRKWLVMVLDLIWTDVVLNPTSLYLLLRSPSCNATNLGRVRSFTLHIRMPVLPADIFTLCHNQEEPNYVNRRREQLRNDLGGLIEHFQHMSNLISFSLRIIVPEAGDIEYNYWLDYNILATLIDQLPLTIRYLELDTQGFDKTDIESTPCERGHVCVALSSRLHGVEHVRLRLSRRCSAMLPRHPVSESCTKTLDINMATILLSPFYMGPCEVVSTQSGGPWFQTQGYRRLIEQLINTLATIASQTSASRMQIIECFYDYCGVGHDASPKVIQHDLLARQITSYPFLPIFSSPEGFVVELRRPCPSPDLQATHQLHSGPTVGPAEGDIPDDSLFYRAERNLDCAIEGDTWIQNCRGVRLPTGSTYKAKCGKEPWPVVESTSGAPTSSPPRDRYDYRDCTTVESGDGCRPTADANESHAVRRRSRNLPRGRLSSSTVIQRSYLPNNLDPSHSSAFLFVFDKYIRIKGVFA